MKRRSKPKARRGRSETDEHHYVASYLEDLGFHLDLTPYAATASGERSYPDIVARRGKDLIVVVEVKKRAEFDTEEKREVARLQSLGYAETLGSPFYAWTDGTLFYIAERRSPERQYVSQLRPGAILPPGGECAPLSIGWTYADQLTLPAVQRAAILAQRPIDVPRKAMIDLAEFLGGANDAVLMEGESGAGKSMYAEALARDTSWDPFWLDVALLEENESLETYFARELNKHGNAALDPWSIVSTMNEYRIRDRLPLTGIVIDSIDEWQNAPRLLPGFAREAKKHKLKLIVLGRPTSIDAIARNQAFYERIAFERLVVSLLNDDELVAIERAYLTQFSIELPLSGRAREMARLPAMLAAVAETYQGQREVDPELTEPKLYEEYRKRKVDRVMLSRPTLTRDALDAAIDDAARAMLDRDNVRLSFSVLREIASPEIMEQLNSVGIFQTDVAETRAHNKHFRFRFGRFRDDALADRLNRNALDLETLWLSPVVGRSALEYAAAHDETIRHQLLNKALTVDLIEALLMAREHGWWNEFEEVVLSRSWSPIDKARLAFYAREILSQRPRLLSVIASDAADAVTRQIAYGPDQLISMEAWRALLPGAANQADIDDFLLITRRLLLAGTLSVTDAESAIELAITKRSAKGRFDTDGHEFWPLVAEIVQGQSKRAAGRFLRRCMPLVSLSNSSSKLSGSLIGSFYPGISPFTPDLLRAVENFSAKCSASHFLAWASVSLLDAHVKDVAQYEGLEIAASVGSAGDYGDNGWLLDVILPALRKVISNKSDGEIVRKIERFPRPSRRHPAFLLRAWILAAPVAALEKAFKAVRRLANTRRSGIPSLHQAIEQRAADLPAIAAWSLRASVRKWGFITTYAQAKELNRLIETRGRRYVELARKTIEAPKFVARDMFGTELFSTMSWASRYPRIAIELLVLAIRGGYEPYMLLRHKCIGDALRAVIERNDFQGLADDTPSVADQLAIILPSCKRSIYARHALEFYERAGQEGQRAILLHIDNLPLRVAAAIVDKAFAAIDAGDEDASSDADLKGVDTVPLHNFVDHACWAVIILHQRYKNRIFGALRVDLLRLAQRTNGPARAAALLEPLFRSCLARRKDKAYARDVVDVILSFAERLGGEHLLELIAQNLRPFFGIMTEEQRARLLHACRDTAIIAVGSYDLAMRSEATVLYRELLEYVATRSPKRHVLGGHLWHKYRSDSALQLSDFDESVLRSLLTNPDDETLREVILTVSQVSQSNGRRATSLLLDVVERALLLERRTWAAHDMQFDFSGISIDRLAEVAEIASRSRELGRWPAYLITLGLESQQYDVNSAQRIYDKLVSLSDEARESYRRWRSKVSR